MYDHQTLYDTPLSLLLDSPTAEEQENPNLSSLISGLVAIHRSSLTDLNYSN